MARLATLGFVMAAMAACSGGGGGDPYDLGPLPPPVPDGAAVAQSFRWVASRDLAITVYEGATPARALTSGHDDFKPVWSPAGDLVVFFRALADSGSFERWRTKICVVHADGTGLRELTDGLHADFNPTWTRDGTNRILFNRYADLGMLEEDDVYSTSPEASPGDEVRLDTAGATYEWVDAGLVDGRLIVDWDAFHPLGQTTHLFTPGPGGGYEEVARPARHGNHPWHKLSVSPSQTRVAYMLDLQGNLGDYSDDVLYWAELDLEARTIHDPVLITRPTGRACVNEYPRWSPDETLVLFDSSCNGTPRAYAYRLADGAVFPISDDPEAAVMFVNVEHTPQ
jgi:hypothetical protein